MRLRQTRIGEDTKPVGRVFVGICWELTQTSCIPSSGGIRSKFNHTQYMNPLWSTNHPRTKNKNLRVFLIFRLRFSRFLLTSLFSVATRYIILNSFHAELIDVFPQSSSPLFFLLRSCFLPTPHIAHTFFLPFSK
jgi:hypothetical protein